MLDTDTTAAIIKGLSPVFVTRLLTQPPSSVCVSALTRAELIGDLRSVPLDHPLQRVVDQFLKIVRVLPWDAAAADWYAKLRYRLSHNGYGLGELDKMIAAHSLAAGAVLVTSQPQAFDGIKVPLLLVNWSDS